MSRLTRRLFIAGAAAAAGGGLLVASLPRLKRELRAWRAARPLGSTAWIHLREDGSVLAYTNVTEMGQGAVSGLMQGLAEELDIEWENLHFEMAPVNAAYSAPWGYSTGGSRSVRRLLPIYRELGARARRMLIEAAATRWQVPDAECTTRPGFVVHQSSARSLGYGELAADAAARRPPRTAELKPAAQWRLLGRSLPRLALASMVDGSARYGIDMDLPGLAVAAISHAPTLGGRLESVDKSPALAVAGVKDVVELPDAVAVVASGYWQAQKGLQALAPRWLPGDHLDSASLEQTLADLLQDGPQLAGLDESERARIEALDQALQQGERVDATFAVPLLSQSALEPMNATARPDGEGGIDVWVPTQAQSDAQLDVAAALGISSSKVRIHATQVGGGFGRRLANDYTVQAARIAWRTGYAVKLIWSRTEDMRRSTYRTMARARFQARLGADGRPELLRMRVATLHSYRRIGGLDDMPYAVPGSVLTYAGQDTAVPIGSWRSVDMSQNTFFLECFIDECAAAAGADPFRYRAMLLQDKPRAIAVLDALRQLSRWDAPAGPGTARGLAFAEGFGSFVGQVVEVRGTGPEAFEVTRVSCVLDCGFAVNPGAVAAQVEGGVLFALSAALAEKIDLRAGGVVQTGFDDYPVLRMPQAPAIDVRVISDPAVEPGGVGEPPVPALAPALANAVSKLTGTRIRSLPLRAAAPA